MAIDMKKTVIFVVSLLILSLLCGCAKGEQNEMEITSGKTITLINGVQDADIWILPRTEKNLKTTVWGTATAAGVKTGESRSAPLCDPGDDGLYLFRMIDTDSFYYSAGDITLEAGWSMEIKGSDLHDIIIEVKDENGQLNNTYQVFAARL